MTRTVNVVCNKKKYLKKISLCVKYETNNTACSVSGGGGKGYGVRDGGREGGTGTQREREIIAVKI